MRKLLPAILLSILAILSYGRIVFAQVTPPVGSLKTDVVASVGQYYLSVSGYASPYASIVMTSGNVFIRAAVADSSGNFFISQILIKQGFSNFCLESIDFKRLGDSVTCFSFSPAQGNITMDKLFLPPTLGFANAEIPAGSDAIAFGYTMPGAQVTLFLSNGTRLQGFADKTGYYSFTIRNLKVGKYEAYAKAEYKAQESLTPAKKVSLRALSGWEQFLLFLKNIWVKFVKLVTSVSFGPLWIAAPIIILIIILILKLWPEKFTAVYKSKLFAAIPFKRRERLLHHWWFVGY